MAAIPVSSAALRALFVGASTAVHVVAFVSFGHAPPAPGPESPVATRGESFPVDEVTTPVDALEPAPAPKVDRPAAPAPRSTHRHWYPVAPDHDAHPHDPSLVHAPVAPRSDEAPSPVHEDVERGAEPPVPPRFTMHVSSAARAADATTAQGAPSVAAPGSAGAASPGEDTATSPARPLHAIHPVYPPEARARGVEADVTLVVAVTPEGTVSDARVERSAGAAFDEAALAAVRAARFEPARRGGRAVAVRLRLGYAFRLQE